MTKFVTSISELIDKITPCWPSISEIRLEARKKGIWKEVRRELRKRSHAQKANCREFQLTEAEKTAKEFVRTFLASYDVSWGISDLRKEAKNKRLKWSDIQQELRRIKYENDAELGEALSRNERTLDVKYPHWEIGYERGMSDACFERFLRLERAVGDMISNGIPLEKIAYYTDLSEGEMQKIIEALCNRENRK